MTLGGLIPDHRRMAGAGRPAYGRAMNERYLGYLGGGILVAVIGLTLIGVPPAVTMSAAVVAAFVGLAVIAHEAKERDAVETSRVVPESAPTSGQASPVFRHQVRSSAARLLRTSDHAESSGRWIRLQPGLA